jgi:hypothetical protein
MVRRFEVTSASASGRIRFMWLFATLAVVITAPLAAAEYQNFRYDLELLVNDQPVDFHIAWRCYSGLEGPNFGPGGLILHRQKPTISAHWLVRSLPSGAAIISPLTAFCQEAPDANDAHDGKDYDAHILLIDNPSHPTSLQIFSKNGILGLGYTVRIAKSSIVRLDEPEHDYSINAEDNRVLKSIRDNCTGYQRVLAATYPESIWRKSQALWNEFYHFEKATSGPFYGLDQLVGESGLSLSLVKSGGRWELPSNLPNGPPAEVYFPIDGPRQTTDRMRGDDISRPLPPTTVKIDAVDIPVGPLRTPVYDPETHLFMYLVNQKYSCWNLR